MCLFSCWPTEGCCLVLYFIVRKEKALHLRCLPKASLVPEDPGTATAVSASWARGNDVPSTSTAAATTAPHQEAESCFYRQYFHIQERASFKRCLPKHTKLLPTCHLGISAGILLCFTLLPSSASHQSQKQHRRFQLGTFGRKDFWCKEELGRNL